MSATSGRRTGLLPRLLIATATRALPRGVSRDRYRREFAAEIDGMGRGPQFRYAFGVATHIWALRLVLVKGVDAVHVPFLCRTNMHHLWRRHVNDEGIAFQVCARCTKENHPIEQSRIANAGLGIGLGFGNAQ